MPSTRAKKNLRRQTYLSLVSKVEGQLRDLFTVRNEEDGLTQTALAEKLDVHRSVVTRRLNGQANMTLESVADMVWAVGGCIDVEIYDPALKPEKNHALAAETKLAWQAKDDGAIHLPQRTQSYAFGGGA